MSRSAFTLRLPVEERVALEGLSKIEGRPMNQLLNDAVKSYLQRRGQKEVRLEESLARLRRYRERDPEFNEAIAGFIDSEASYSDPVEGMPLEGELAEPGLQGGSAQSRIRELLGG